MQEKMRQGIFWLIASLLVSPTASAQEPLIPTLEASGDSLEQVLNLVDNPSFEQYEECPQKVDAHGVLTTVKGWHQPTSGSADYYNVCGARECGVPKNKLGIQYPHSGRGFCGIYCSKTDYREYLQTQLKEPLKAGETYQLEFYVSLSEYSAGAVSSVGALLSAERLQDTGTYTLMHKEIRPVTTNISQIISTYYTPQVQNDYFRLLSNTASWTKISGTFVAAGGENFLTIGNFLPASQSNVTDIETLTYLLPGAYYYIDDVRLRCLACSAGSGSPVAVAEEQPRPESDFALDAMQTATDQPDSVFQVGATFILRNIYFDFDKSVLLQQSHVELQGLLQVLHRYPKMRIEVGGHTDGEGTVDYNQHLSEKRAQAVVEYLISNGIDKQRLQYKGYGKSNPISTNDTEEGRSLNRRVEFVILSM